MAAPAGDAWHQHAVNARQCLRMLGYPVTMNACLQGEAGHPECGYSDYMHFLAYLAVIRAVADHYLGHVKSDDTGAALADMYREAADEMAGACGEH